MTQLRATSGPWLGLGSAQSVPAGRYIRPRPPFSILDRPYLLFSRYDELGASYARAREHQQHLRADELLEIVDDNRNDWMDVETKGGRIIRQFDHEHAKRSELRIKTRQWLMTRFAPRVFGERIQLDASKETREAIAAQSPQERLEGALALIARAKRRVADALASGEISEADFEDVSGDEER
jgi:hypothetical protein